jgi:hypothetical protein
MNENLPSLDTAVRDLFADITYSTIKDTVTKELVSELRKAVDANYLVNKYLLNNLLNGAMNILESRELDIAASLIDYKYVHTDYLLGRKFVEIKFKAGYEAFNYAIVPSVFNYRDGKYEIENGESKSLYLKNGTLFWFMVPSDSKYITIYTYLNGYKGIYEKQKYIATLHF